MKTKYFTLCAALLSGIFSSLMMNAQDSTNESSVFFETNKSDIRKESEEILTRLASEITENCELKIFGNTDSRGDESYNIALAQRRCESVRDFLSDQGLDVKKIKIAALGEAKPIADNSTDSGKQKNRRVDIIIKCTELLNETVTAERAEPEGENGSDELAKLMALIARPPQIFEIDPSVDTVLVGEEGCIVHFRANSIVLPTQGTKKVTITIRENLSKSSMVLDNLATMSGSGILETGGMVEVLAFDQDNRPLQLKADGMTVLVPTTKSDSRMDLFDGKRSGKRKTATWKQRSTGEMTVFSVEDVWNCEGYNRYYRAKCNLWCRIGTLFSPTTENVMKRSGIRRESSNSCRIVKSIVRKYNVTDYEQLKMAMNAELYASVGAANEEEYRAILAARQDSINKMMRQNVEANITDGTVSQNDLQYYIFSNSKFGMYNCDYFMDLPKSDVIALDIPNPQGTATYLALVLEGPNVVISPEYRSNSFYFKKVKEGIRATIVAIRPGTDQPEIAMQSVILDKELPELQFESVSLEMLKERVKLVDGKLGDTVMR